MTLTAICCCCPHGITDFTAPQVIRDRVNFSGNDMTHVANFAPNGLQKRPRFTQSTRLQRGAPSSHEVSKRGWVMPMAHVGSLLHGCLASFDNDIHAFRILGTLTLYLHPSFTVLLMATRN